MWELKWRAINVDMAPEYAKDVVYEESIKKLDYQIYVFSKQHHRMNRINNKVDILIAEAPLLLSAVYDKTNNKLFHDFIFQEHNEFHNFNIYLQRNEAHFDPRGRVQKSVGEAKAVDERVKEFLTKYNIDYTVMESRKDNLVPLADMVEAEFKKLNNIA